jgi:hypothetical protein
MALRGIWNIRLSPCKMLTCELFNAHTSQRTVRFPDSEEFSP